MYRVFQNYPFKSIQSDILETVDDIEKYFGQKLNGFEWHVMWCNRFFRRWRRGRHMEVDFDFLNVIIHFFYCIIKTIQFLSKVFFSIIKSFQGIRVDIFL